MDNTIYFNYDNPEQILDTAKELDNLLTKNGFPVFLNAGTLLGSVRSNDLLPHDDDVDLFYMSKKLHRKAVLDEFENIIQPILEKDGWTVKLIIWKLNGPQIMMGQYHVIKNNISMDLWAGWFNDKGRLNVTMAIEDEPIYKTDLFPPRKGIIRNYTFNIPNNAELHLSTLYGENWKIPDSKYKIPCNRNFLQKTMLKVIDQFGWAYFFIAKAQDKYSYHNISYKRLQDMNEHMIDEDVIYFHSPGMGVQTVNKIISTGLNRKRTKIIGGYGGESPLMYNDADLIVTISFPFLQKLKEKYPNKPCIFLPEAIDCDYFNIRRYKRNKFDVGYVGRPCKVKRCHLLDELDYDIKKHMNWGKEHFTEDRTLDDVKNFYKTVDCLVLTSQSECMPRVVLEAMASGLPVISTDVGCMRMLLDPEWIVPNSSEEDIIKNINDRLHILKKYPSIRKAVGKRNKEYITENFNWKSTQPIWDNIINALANDEYDKIKTIGDELELKWGSLYNAFEPVKRTDLVSNKTVCKLSNIQLTIIDEIQNVMPNLIMLNKTCLDIINNTDSLGNKFYFGCSEAQTEPITKYFLSKGFSRVPMTGFIKDNYMVSLNVYKGKTKSYCYKGIKTSVPLPVVAYLESLFGNNWKTA